MPEFLEALVRDLKGPLTAIEGFLMLTRRGARHQETVHSGWLLDRLAIVHTSLAASRHPSRPGDRCDRGG